MIHTLFEQFRSNDTEWFAMHADGHATLATMHSVSTAKYVPLSCLRNLSVLRAATALSLLHGMSTIPWDPVFLHFLVHDCNILSMHPGIVGEWHPELKQMISNWLDVGPRDDITQFREYFASYHDIQVAYLNFG